MTLANLFRGPQLDDPRDERAAAVLAPLLSVLTLALGLMSLAGLTLAWARPWQTVASFIATGVFVWARLQVHRGRIAPAAALTTGLLMMMSLSSVLADGTSAVYPAAFCSAIGVGGITLRRPGPLWLGALSSVIVLGVNVAQHHDWLVLQRPMDEPGVAVMQCGGFAVLAGAIHWANEALDQARARALAQEQRSQALQQSLVRGQRMESVGRLAGGIAHDFNNLLTVITSNTAYLDGSGESDDVAAARSAIRKACESGSNLTRQLLAFSGRQVTRAEVIDVAEIIGDFRPVLEHMGDRHALAICAKDATLRIRVDPGQLQQALGNLVVNAANASDIEDEIRIDLQTVSLHAARTLSHGSMPKGEYVVLSVSDTGRGMDAETLAGAFDPFYTTRGAEGGSGLGLAVVHGFVTQSGGQVHLESTEGEGTTVALWFPRVKDPTTWRPVAAPAPVGRPLDGKTILLVDDTDEARTAVRRQLERAGATVLEADGGASALEIVGAEQTITAALIDVLMPEMSGPDLVVELRKRDFSAPITFLTGYADPDSFTGAAAGTPIVYKPVTTADLVKALDV